ncbi:MAG: hypothetical protein HYZ87_03160 [Candidatus Omnitrophica bacterium]|nr:hypothetical protein [Candidatus Omnitrophota bacterium]
MFAAVALIALALGYKVFTDAYREKDGLKILGQIVGVFVMVAALFGFICGISRCATKGQYAKMGKANCAMMAKANCPMQNAPSGSSSQAS